MPWVGVLPGKQLLLDVRVTRQKTIIKKAISKGKKGSLAFESLSLPRPNQKISLLLVRSLRPPPPRDGEDFEGELVRATVVSSIQRAIQSPVARVLIVVE